MTPVSDAALEVMHTTATEIFTGAIKACDIPSAFDHRLRFEGHKLNRLMPDGSGPAVIDLSAYKRIFVIAMGKAAGPMLQVLLDRMKRRKGLRGICCTNQTARGPQLALPLLRRRPSSPQSRTPSPLRVPRWPSCAKPARTRSSSSSSPAAALPSSTCPSTPQITLEETVAFTSCFLLRARPSMRSTPSASIFRPLKVVASPWPRRRRSRSACLVPDVPLRTLDALASGPSTPDHSTVADVRELLAKYDLAPKLPPSIRSLL